MCRLLQQLRDFPREQVADPALQSLDLMKLDVQGAERRVDPDHVGQIDILFTRVALYHRFRTAGGLR